MDTNLNEQLWRQSRLPMILPDLKGASPLGLQERGAVFTRREVVEFILDLVGYTPGKQLYQMHLLEPCVGQGDFLVPVIDRLLAAWHSKSQSPNAVVDLQDAIRGVELHAETFCETRTQVIRHLQGHGLSTFEATQIADTWLIQDDFLLAELDDRFHFVVGNPPYVRQELISDALMAEYRERYSTIYDRADLYIPFIERSLHLLEQGGQLGFICADRWMKNRYGGPLRKMISTRFSLKTYVDMVDTPAFQSDVIAYPAITVIAREQGTTTRIAHRPEITKDYLSKLATMLTARTLHKDTDEVRSLDGIVVGAEPWIFEAPDQVALARRLEAEFPTLEGAGCRVGIGVATGADKAFIGPYDELDVEQDRKIPLATTRDILKGKVEWRGLAVINPFAQNGNLVNLASYPKLRQWLEARREQIEGRHVAQVNPMSWYRTIDRIYPDLALKPKLLIPDIKGVAHIVYEGGHLYPHHNLYYIVSEEWDLKALQAVLLSGIARLFVSIYSIRMRGGYMRFQAQYLRRIRLPKWDQVPERLKRTLVAAAEQGDVETCNLLTYELYGMTEAEQEALGGF
jgi:hypothetical protein